MSGKTLLCLGYGYVARRFAAGAAAAGWRIAATARRAETAAAIAAAGGRAVLWENEAVDAAARAADALLVSVPPDERGCPAFRAAANAAAARARDLVWIGYLSSNGVYGDHQGAAVDEQAPLKATSARARSRIRAEAEWAGCAAAFALPLVIFRLPGIYGPGRSVFDAIRSGRAQRIDRPGHVFNRMHVDDIAAALLASLADPRAGELFNLADDLPAAQHEVVEFACRLLGRAPPPLVAFDDAVLSAKARSFYADGKRASNALMKERLGVRLLYPSYREGLAAVLAEERGVGNGA